MLTTVTSPNDIEFTIWGRDSGPHVDLSIECAEADQGTEDGKKYHGFLEHMKDMESCGTRENELAEIVEKGGEITEGKDVVFLRPVEVKP